MAWSIFTQGGGPEVAVGWAEQLLSLIGAPKTPGNIEFVYQWQKSEGGGGKFNPLNQGPDPGHPTYTTTGSQFGGGAADYASWQAGLYGARDYLNMPAYSGVRDALLANQPAQARAALWASPWAASHYGYGRTWYGGTIPGGQAVMPPASLLAASSGDPATCWAGLPNLNPIPSWVPGLGGSTSTCLISKSQLRGFQAVLVMGVGGLILLYGVSQLLSIAVAPRAVRVLISPVVSAGRQTASTVRAGAAQPAQQAAAGP